MKINTEVWSKFYADDDDVKPLVPESFIARVFLSTSPIKLLKSFCFKGKKVLDVGCGNGRHSFFLSQLGFDVYGCEVDGVIAEKLNIKFSTNNFFASYVDCIDSDDESYDYVVGANSIYYLDNEDSTIKSNLSELERVLTKRGCMVISFIGEEHFLLNKCKVLDDRTVIIQKDPLEFRNDTRIRPAWGKDDIHSMFECFEKLSVYKICEIKDACAEFTRHIYYCVIYKD